MQGQSQQRLLGGQENLSETVDQLTGVLRDLRRVMRGWLHKGFAADNQYSFCEVHDAPTHDQVVAHVTMILCDAFGLKEGADGWIDEYTLLLYRYRCLMARVGR